MDIQNKSDFAKLEHISLEQFFPLICSESHRHAVIWQKRPAYEIIWRVFHCARNIVSDWNCDFAEMGKQDEFFLQCAAMFSDWQWELVDPLSVEIAHPNILRLVNGHHRSFTLGCLLLTEKEQFRPLPVLNEARLKFDTESNTSILLSYSPSEFLQFAKLSPEQRPIGEIPKNMRLTNRKRYDLTLIDAQELWRDKIKAEGIDEARIKATLQCREDRLLFDDIVIVPSDESLAIAAAFVADAVLNKIQVGTVFWRMFSPSVIVNPPYIL